MTHPYYTAKVYFSTEQDVELAVWLMRKGPMVCNTIKDALWVAMEKDEQHEVQEAVDNLRLRAKIDDLGEMIDATAQPVTVGTLAPLPDVIVNKLKGKIE